MLISRVVDEGGEVGGADSPPSPREPSPQCQAAEELFELMAKDSKFEPGEDKLTQRDLVLLYKNLDLGTQLMTNATLPRRRPNQLVETIVYKEKEEDSEDSDISAIYSNEDLQSLYVVNKCRRNLSSHTLCNKNGKIAMNSSDLTMEYNKNFVFRDPYLQNQLQSLNLFTSNTTIQGVVPISLLDYICCKRLEDNYNFYLDNIIKYVQHTIEQLKRISNGDYLTERVKEKWRQMEKKDETIDCEKSTKVLATSTSIPLHVERKFTGHATTWDDIVHSEVDIRSLSKILEKKIVIDIPKLFSGSYNIMSKCCVDNLIVSCTKNEVRREADANDSRVDVVFELKRSCSGHVTSDISSIMIVQKSPGAPHFKLISNENLPLAYLDNASGGSVVSVVPRRVPSLDLIPIQGMNLGPKDAPDKSSEVYDSKHLIIESEDSKDADSNSRCQDKNNSASLISNTKTSTNDEPAKEGSENKDDVFGLCPTIAENQDSEQPNERTEADFGLLAPNELGLSMRRLAVQGTLKEESEDDSEIKSKPQAKVRVKSPYENKSLVIEEKKRKRLLEIRERREMKKIAMQEFCKLVKHKYGKGFAMPQASSSVTKLSITNKSFYNSIYGQNAAVHNKQVKNKTHRRGHKRQMSPPGSHKTSAGDHLDHSNSSMNSELDSNKKFINRSYYLDEVETEMMNMDSKNIARNVMGKTQRSKTAHLVAELERLSGLMQPSESKSDSDDYDDDDSEEDEDDEGESSAGEESAPFALKSRSKLNVTPEPLSPKRNPYSGNPGLMPAPPAAYSGTAGDVLGGRRSSTSLQCRRSIERVYDHMNNQTGPDCQTGEAEDKLNVTPEPYHLQRGPYSGFPGQTPAPSAAYTGSADDVPGGRRSSTSLECRRSFERVYDLMNKLTGADCQSGEDDEGESSAGEESAPYSVKSRNKLNVTPEPDHLQRGPYSGNPGQTPAPSAVYSGSAGDVLGGRRSSTSLQCRRSIERVYNLMNKLTGPDCQAGAPSASEKLTMTHTTSVTNPTVASDSGTSLKHQLSSNNSCQSFRALELKSTPSRPNKTQQKNPMQRYDRNKPGRLNIIDDMTPDVTGDPIKTNSRLKDGIDFLANIPAKASKATEAKPMRNLKEEVRLSPRQVFPKKPAPKSREAHPILPDQKPKKRLTPAIPENKPLIPREKFPKRKIIDITDEEKEARGEAVRGPSKCRLNALAQPRKTYVQAHIAEVQNKYGRSAISDRLQRLAGCPPPSPVPLKVKPLRKLTPSALLPSSVRHPAAARPADPERGRARNPAPDTRRRASDRAEPLLWDERRLRRCETSPERPRAPLRRDPPHSELEKTLLAMSTLQALSLHALNMASPRAAPTRVLAVPNLPDLVELTESSRSPHSSRSPRSPCSPRSPRGPLHRPRDSSADHVTDIFQITPHVREQEEDNSSELSKESKSKSNAEIATLAAALDTRRAKSAVNNHLRIQSLTLTPRHSLQQLLALQSGEASVSELKMVKSSDDARFFNSLAKGSRLAWNFDLKPQVTTVGYAFASYDNALNDKPYEIYHLKSSSSVRSGSAELRDNKSSSEPASMDRDHSKWAAESTQSNTMTSDGLLSQYYGPEQLLVAAHSEVSECVQADCKELNESFGNSSLASERSIGRIVADAMKSLVVDAVAESGKVQASESCPFTSKNRMTSGHSAQTIVENIAGPKPVADVGVGCGLPITGLRVKPRLPKTEHSAQTVDSFTSSRKTTNKDPKTISNKTAEYSSSLDILVGLLNEIQTITACQTNMTRKMADKGHSLNNLYNHARNRKVNQSLSITSLQNIKQLESNSSIYSIYVSNDGDRCGLDSIKSEIIQTSCLLNKRVDTSNIDLTERRLVSCSTDDVPSRVFYNIGLTNIHQSTSVDPVVERQSIISLQKYNSVVSATDVRDRPNARAVCAINKVHKKVGAKHLPSLSIKVDERSRIISNRRIKAKHGWDQGMKMKRDILVAVYSMLVLTVFAALSFPDLLQYR